MLYFSEIQNKKVYTEDEIFVGNLVDFIFLAQDIPKITKLVLKTKTDKSLMIPIEFLIKIDGNIFIEKNYIAGMLENNELYLMKNLLDTQIIDIVGSKIIRVNDVIIAQSPEYHIAGVDIGLLGILRRLKLENAVNRASRILGRTITSRFLSWGDIQPLELASGHVRIKKEEKRLDKIPPEDLADYLEKTNLLNVRKILNIMDEQKAADVIGELNINYQTALFKNFTYEKIAKIVSLIEPEEAADILLTLPKKKREKILSSLSTEVRHEIEYLIKLSKTPIGDILSTEYITVESHITTSRAIEIIRKETTDFGYLHYIYVVNNKKQLVGVFSLHELLLQASGTPIYKFMVQNLSVVYLTTPELVVFKKMMKYRLSTLPVLDKNKNILGVIHFDQIVDLIAHFND